MEKFPQCAICGTTQQLLRCAKCKTVFYCSTAHQHMDWPKHKQSCRMLATQRNNSRMNYLQQAVASTTINRSPQIELPKSTGTNNEVDAGYESFATPTNNTGNIEFAYPGGGDGSSESAFVDTKLPVNYENGGSLLNQQASNKTDVNARNNTEIAIRDEENAVKCGEALQQNNEASYHRVDQRLLSPQYHLQQHLLMQQQLRRKEFSPPETPYTQLSKLNSHNTHHHHYEKSISCQVGSGGGVDKNAFGNSNERRYDELCRNIINDMNQYGLSVVDDFLGVEKGLQILNDVHRMYAAGVFKDGQLVNNLREKQTQTIRGDKITWVKGVEPGCANIGYLINQIDAVICRANTMKNNGQLGNYIIKERTKAMVACYPGSGSHYVVHVDNPNKDGRVITAIYYLNVNWDTERSGGVLRIFPEHGNSVADIEPKFDRLIFFWSDRRNPHEVQPSHRTRYAITVWYFDANEREAALNRIKHNVNNISKIPKATTKSESKNAMTTATTGGSTTTNMPFDNNSTSNTSDSSNTKQQESTAANETATISVTATTSAQPATDHATKVLITTAPTNTPMFTSSNANATGNTNAIINSMMTHQDQHKLDSACLKSASVNNDDTLNTNNKNTNGTTNHISAEIALGSSTNENCT